MLQTFVESVFNLLGRSSLQRLGVECVSSGVWMLFCLILCSALIAESKSAKVIVGTNQKKVDKHEAKYFGIKAK